MVSDEQKQQECHLVQRHRRNRPPRDYQESEAASIVVVVEIPISDKQNIKRHLKTSDELKKLSKAVGLLLFE